MLLFNFTNNRSEPWTPDVRSSSASSRDPNSTNVFFQEQSWNQVEPGRRRLRLVPACAVEQRLRRRRLGRRGRRAGDAARARPRRLRQRRLRIPARGLVRLGRPGRASRRPALAERRHLRAGRVTRARPQHGRAPRRRAGVPRRRRRRLVLARSEYGDPFSSMGSSTRRMAGWHLQQLGYIGLEQRPDGDDRRHLHDPHHAHPDQRAAAAQDPAPVELARPEYYYVDLRASGGVFDNFRLGRPDRQAA